MATKPVVPFWDLDVSKLISEFKVPGIDVDGLMAAQRKNIEAVTAANKVAFEGMQAVATRQAEILRQTMQEMSSVMSDLMSAGTPEERVAKQADLAKQAFEKALANMREIAEMITKANTEAADLINKRISATLDELKVVASARK